jgi:AAA+ ATPase superfamily predicted ATPase
MERVGPILLDKFAGREKELKRLEKIKRDYLNGYRRNLALIGPPNIGKTSLILKFLDCIEGELFPIYLNLENRSVEESVLGFLLFVLHKLSGFEEEFGITNIEEAIRQVSSKYPKIGQALSEISSYEKKMDRESLLRIIFKFPHFLYETFRKCCVFVIDEFFEFERFKVDKWMQILREHVMLDEHTLFILISSEEERAKSILNSELSLLFGNFELMELRNFSHEEAMEFIYQRLEAKVVDKEVLRALITLTNGVPLYLDLLTEWMRDKLESLDWEGLVTALEENIFDNKGFLYRHFKEKIESLAKGRRLNQFLPYVFEIARGNTRAKVLREKVGQTWYFSRSLNGFLEKSGSFYRIKDPLFKFWLLYAYEPSLIGIKVDPYQRRKAIFNELKSLGYRWSEMGIPQVEVYKQLLKDLFMRFGNEFIEVKGKRKQMPRIRWVEEIDRIGTCFVFKCVKERGKPWLVIFSVTETKEEEVYSILSYLKRKVSAFAQRIFIQLTDLDENIASILKAKGFWVWEGRFLFKLMEFYGIRKGIYTMGLV